MDECPEVYSAREGAECCRFVKDSPLLSGEDGLVQGPSELQVGLRCQKMGQRDLVAGRRGEALLGSGLWLFL